VDHVALQLTAACPVASDHQAASAGQTEGEPVDHGADDRFDAWSADPEPPGRPLPSTQGPSPLVVGASLLAAVGGLLLGGICALVAFVGSDVGGDGAYDGWAWSTIVLALGGPLCAFVPALLIRRAATRQDAGVVFLVLSSIALGIGALIAWVGVRVLLP
jgi:hypothetical protein